MDEERAVRAHGKTNCTEKLPGSEVERTRPGIVYVNVDRDSFHILM